MKIISGIYKILNTNNGKFYIGSSKNILKRYKQHLKELEKGKHINRHLQSSFNKYGDVFKLIILEICNENILSEREKYYIDYTKSLDEKIGYNINPFADRPPSWKGKKHTNETKEKMSKSQKGKITNDYVRQVASKTHKNKKLSKEQILFLKEHFKGKNNPMYNKSVYDVWLEKYGKEIADEKYNSWINNKIKNSLKGDNNPSCKIKNDDAKIIYERILNGESVSNIAKEYNVNKITIYNIKNGKRKIY